MDEPLQPSWSDLPAPVAGWLAACAGPGPYPAAVELEMAGDFLPSGRTRWQSWEGTETIRGDEIAFDWRATLRLPPVRVHDGLADGQGWERAELLGVRTLHERRDAQLTKTQLIRYLAELVLVPEVAARLASAPAGERLVHFEAVGERQFTLGARLAAEGGLPVSATVTVFLDVRMRPLSATASDRPRKSEAAIAEWEWRMDVDSLRELAGVTAPVSYRAAFVTPDGHFDPYRTAEVSRRTPVE